MYKFFTPSDLFSDTHATIVGDDVKHIYKVLRIEIGEKVIVNNLQGTEYLGEIEEVNKQQVNIKLLQKLEINNESPLEIYLFQGLPKSAKMDLIVQKGTELGIKEIIPTITSRVDVKLKGEFKKLDRLQRIALEACKQCKRTLIPEVKEPVEFKEMMEVLMEMDLVVVPYENAEGYGIRNMVSQVNSSKIKKAAIIVGPEGGFEEEEIEELRSKGAYIVTLGPRILRTETAGFVCASLLQYELGDIGGKF
ncbi:ribosomal RNA small subunit methyltransferase E [Clostridium polyendosporum]|uniref:Ribosomal RNA small subunit methyltransferase E n=1 Tax=Clostridium polyendosporum TaxID=69208 RepID=A0A919RX38_9CLOT|nr:16S rRNA (uracil(1498)-N(3))-methyltransferase [Clostridium polyendosporum]GIM28077.1 ribosomal RNA small subunit methyltransferase E [Clostridium polyendosporum]